MGLDKVKLLEVGGTGILISQNEVKQSHTIKNVIGHEFLHRMNIFHIIIQILLLITLQIPDDESLFCIGFFRLFVNNVDEWSIAHLELDPSQNFASLESLKVFINSNQAFIDIIGRAELAWYRKEIVD